MVLVGKFALKTSFTQRRATDNLDQVLIEDFNRERPSQSSTCWIQFARQAIGLAPPACLARRAPGRTDDRRAICACLSRRRFVEVLDGRLMGPMLCCLLLVIWWLAASRATYNCLTAVGFLCAAAARCRIPALALW